ncbi:S-layer homology domain-containing protein [Paenibacillus antibioticophila]|uniref:S-layer homology domain-containing protein n=2 Tax=Bacteria TaxID=2 RepID=UPI0005CB1C4D|nr:S-layer homology domain-containing protein [Paenibacillus antibioticophila]
MKKTVVSMVMAVLMVVTSMPMAYALSPVAEVYYNVGTSVYDASDFESALNDAVKAKLIAADVNPKYVSIMDASADPAAVSDMQYVHNGRASWYIDYYNFVITPSVETADYNHVQVSNGGNTLTFYGYTVPGYKDFMLTDGSPSGKKIITFDMDESKVDYHSMEGGGFLFNTQIDGAGKLSGYAILYVEGEIKVYKLDSIDASALHNETSRALSNMTGVTSVGSFTKGSATQHTIKIVATDTTLNMWDNGDQLIRNLSLPDVYGNEFGPIVSHIGHSCDIISIFSFENMKLYSTSSKSLDVAVDNIHWGTAPLRYVVNINDDPRGDLDEGDKQAKLTDSFNQNGLQYVGVTEATYEDVNQRFIDDIFQSGFHIESTKPTSEIIEELASRIADKLIADYKDAIEDIEQAEDVTDIQFNSGDSKNSVRNNLTLLDDAGVTTVWSSDQPSIIAPDGTVTRPVTAQSGVYVNLKATITKDGLTSEKTFTVYVLAANPAPLSSLSVEAGNGQATLSFPELIGATDIIVEQSTDKINYSPATLLEALDASSTSATVTGLVNGETYYFRLQVVSGFYQGESNVVEALPSESLTTLSAETGDQQIILNFPSLGTSDIVVEQSEDGINFSPVTPVETLDATSTSATVTGLTNGKSYHYRLVIGSGVYRGVSNIVQASPSEPVTNLAAVAGMQQVTLTFPPLTGASSIIIEQSTDGENFYPINAVETLNDASTTATITNLSSRETYHFRLRVESGERAGVSNVVTVKPGASSEPVTTPSTGSGSGTGSVQQPAATMKTEPVVSDQANGGKVVQEKITKLVGDNLRVSGKIKSANGQTLNLPNVVMNQDGSFTLPKVAPGEYTLSLNVIAPNGEKLAGPAGKLTVDNAGNAKLSVDLVDPYGTILDEITGQPAAGVNMQLYWADTELNRSKGRMPGTLVNLPELADFAPNNNHNPQVSSDSGEYGWMVYADGDYYFLGEKDGYTVFDSRKDSREESFGTDSYIKDGIIHVGDTIVKFSFSLQPKLKDSGDHTPYMVGYPDGTFKTDQGIVRSEVAAILSRLYTSAASSSKVSYADVNAKHWAANAITTATNNKWMVGFGNNTFKPNQQITRAEFAQILMNLYKWDAASESSYTDIKGYWAEKAIATVEQQGLLFDFTGETFDPGEPITRLEVVRILNQLLGRHPWDIQIGQKWTDVPASHPHYSDIMEASTPHNFDQFETGIESWK